MTEQTDLPEEAIEAAAKEIWAIRYSTAWAPERYPDATSVARAMAADALAAALPLLREQTAQEIEAKAPCACGCTWQHPIRMARGGVW